MAVSIRASLCLLIVKNKSSASVKENKFEEITVHVYINGETMLHLKVAVYESIRIGMDHKRKTAIIPTLQVIIGLEVETHSLSRILSTFEAQVGKGEVINPRTRLQACVTAA
jgi:hypothetical protein